MGSASCIYGFGFGLIIFLIGVLSRLGFWLLVGFGKLWVRLFFPVWSLVSLLLAIVLACVVTSGAVSLFSFLFLGFLFFCIQFCIPVLWYMGESRVWFLVCALVCWWYLFRGYGIACLGR